MTLMLRGLGPPHVKFAQQIARGNLRQCCLHGDGNGRFGRRGSRRPFTAASAATCNRTRLYSNAPRSRASAPAYPSHYGPVGSNSPYRICRHQSTTPPGSPPAPQSPSPRSDNTTTSTAPLPRSDPAAATRKPRRLLFRTITVLLFLSVPFSYYFFFPRCHSSGHRRRHGTEILHPELFKPWVLVDRIPGSDPTRGATAKSAIFVFQPLGGGRRGGEGGWKEYWPRGVWSVELKQPDLMIARRYTPLPPLRELALAEQARLGGDEGTEPLVIETGSGTGGKSDEDELRFFIKLESQGEVSRWLFGLPVGTIVYLRGPGWEYEYPWWGKNGGNQKGMKNNTEEKQVGREEDIEEDTSPIPNRAIAFLAGGTGIAPALQVAASFFYPENRPTINTTTSPKPDSGTTTPSTVTPETSISIHWAVRKPGDIAPQIAQDLNTLTKIAELAKRKPEPSSARTATDSGTTITASSPWLSTPASPQPSPLPPVNLTLTPWAHIDSFNTFITPHDIEHALGLSSSPLSSSPSSASLSLLSRVASLLSFLSASSPSPHPPSPLPQRPSSSMKPKENYILLSGPEGFISYLAGEKGPDGASQGRVGGMLRGLIGKWMEEEEEEEEKEDREKEKKKIVGPKVEGRQMKIPSSRWFIWKL
ncbi:hypothetical protein BDZ91DRAFT_715117 [Kalaharituber pfeilii]|nr:hypothetical protein BDZ91DRAFT_715117 [Kalaharituber pfeilii]